MKRKRLSLPATSITIFVDRSLGGKAVPRALRDAAASDVTILSHDEVFSEQDTADEVWLKKAGELDWIVLTKDDWLRYRPNEKEALAQANTVVIILVAQGLRGSKMGSLFASVLPNIIELATHSVRPAVYKLMKNGRLKHA